jgi:hypothetical protein
MFGGGRDGSAKRHYWVRVVVFVRGDGIMCQLKVGSYAGDMVKASLYGRLKEGKECQNQ